MFYFIFLYLKYAIPDAVDAVAINPTITSFTPVCGNFDAVDLLVVIVFGVFVVPFVFVSFFAGVVFFVSFFTVLFVVLFVVLLLF